MKKSLLVTALILGSVVFSGCSQVSDSFQEGFEKGKEVYEDDVSFNNQSIDEGSVRTRIKSTEVKSIAMTPENVTRVEVKEDEGSENESDKIINVYYELNTDVGGSLRKVKSTAATAVYVIPSLFEHPDVSTVNIWLEGDFLNEQGNKTKQTAIRIGMERPTSNETNWENAQEQVVTLGEHQFILDLADNTYIQPSIASDL